MNNYYDNETYVKVADQIDLAIDARIRKIMEAYDDKADKGPYDGLNYGYAVMREVRARDKLVHALDKLCKTNPTDYI